MTYIHYSRAKPIIKLHLYIQIALSFLFQIIFKCLEIKVSHYERVFSSNYSYYNAILQTYVSLINIELINKMQNQM